MTFKATTIIEHDFSKGKILPPTLTVLVGPPASGKTSLAKKLITNSMRRTEYVSKDDLRKLGISDENEVRHRELNAAIELLSTGTDVIVDDTNCTPESRRLWEEAARSLQTRIRFIVMNTPREICIERDRVRGDKQVGRAAINKHMKDLMEAPVKVMTATKHTKLTHIFEHGPLIFLMIAIIRIGTEIFGEKR